MQDKGEVEDGDQCFKITYINNIYNMCYICYNIYITYINNKTNLINPTIKY